MNKQYSKSDGKYIVIEFSDPIIGDLGGNELHFSIVTHEYDYAYSGEIIEVNKSVKSVSHYLSIDETVDFTLCEINDLAVDGNTLKLGVTT